MAKVNGKTLLIRSSMLRQLSAAFHRQMLERSQRPTLRRR